MNIVIYARYSSDKQTEDSIVAQLKVCREFADKEGFVVIGEYIDRGKSGTSSSRPEFLCMIEDSKKKQFQGVLVYQLDRFARSREDSAHYKHKLKKNGVRVLSAKENISTDASGILMESVLEGMAEYYSVELGQKVTRNMILNAENGYSNGHVPLGYKSVPVQIGTRPNGDIIEKKKLEIDEEMACIVREIFLQCSLGKPTVEIIDYLNKRQIKTSRGGEFRPNSFRHLLQNEKYIGIYRYGDIVNTKAIPPIIDKKLFAEVQKILENNKKVRARNKAKEEYILTLKLFCGLCKEMMVGVSGTSQTKKKHKYYACKGKCGKKRVTKKWIEDLVIKHCNDILTTENIRLIADAVVKQAELTGDNRIIDMLQKSLLKLEKEQNNLADAIAQNSNEDFRQVLYGKLNQIIAKKKELETQIATDTNNATMIVKAPQIRFFLNKLRETDISDKHKRKALITIFVNSIYLYDLHDGKKRLDYIFNIGEKRVEITETLCYDIVNHGNSSFIDCCGSPNANESNLGGLTFLLHCCILSLCFVF